MFELGLWCSVWVLTNRLVKSLTQIPGGIKKSKDQAEYDKRAVTYQNFFLSLIHALVALALSKLSALHSKLQHLLEPNSAWPRIH
jgi:hypothetical protein